MTQNRDKDQEESRTHLGKEHSREKITSKGHQNEQLLQTS